MFVVAVNAGNVNAGDAAGKQFIKDCPGKKVAVGLQHDLRCWAVLRPQRVQDCVKDCPLGKRLAPGKDHPIGTGRKVANNGQTFLQAHPFAAWAGVVVAVVALVVAKLREDPVDGFDMIKRLRHILQLMSAG
ncbi:MAG: hypothetical protein UZ07_CHB004003442 [Chlorobi bacterium OLB7]|nr:MAG: hypothetical protein UZ07_CHB004003442 [Chlorobi bacterium OLB7]